MGVRRGSVAWRQVHWLTLGANLLNSSAQLFLQLPQIETVSYQTNITVSRLRQELRGQASASLDPVWPSLALLGADHTGRSRSVVVSVQNLCACLWSCTAREHCRCCNDLGSQVLQTLAGR